MNIHRLVAADDQILNHGIAKQGTCPGCFANTACSALDTQNHSCEPCKRHRSTLQYLRDFHSRSFKEACRQLGMELNVAPHTLLPEYFTSYNHAGMDIPDSEWQEQALSFVMDCHYRLMSTPKALGLLYDRGFTDGTMQQFYLGWHEALSDESKRPWPPVGIVVPTFDLRWKRLVKIRVQPVEDQKLCVSVSGRIKSAGVYGDAAGKPVVVLERELDAMLVQQCAGDVCCPVALGGCKYPDKAFDTLLRDAPLVLFAHDNDVTSFRWWVRRYPELVEWEMPCRGVREEAFGVGSIMRSWVLEGIRLFG